MENLEKISPAGGETNGRDTRASLLLRLKGGGEPGEVEKAWEEFHEQYAKSIFRWCCSIGVPRRDVPDLTQDVMLKLLQELKQFQYDPQRRFRGWLKTITQRLAIDFLRKHRRLVLSDGSSFGDLFTTETVQAKFEQMLLLEEAKSLVLAELHGTEFGRRNWEIFLATTELGEPAAAVARRLGVKVQLVYVEKNRVLNRLRRAVAALEADGEQAT